MAQARAFQASNGQGSTLGKLRRKLSRPFSATPALRQMTQPFRKSAKATRRNTPVPLLVAGQKQASEFGSQKGLAAQLSWWLAVPKAEFELLFERGFYLRQLDPTEATPGDLVSHYVEHGVARALSPNRLFEPSFYAEQCGLDPAAEDMFCHYLQTGWLQGLRPHPEFPEMSGCSQAPLLTVLKHGRHDIPTLAGRRAASAQDEMASFVTWQRTCGQEVLRAPLRRAVASLVKEFPAYDEVREELETVFDLRFYAGQLKRAGRPVPRMDLLRHYVTEGYAAGFRPHPLFDPLHYLEHNPDVANAGKEPLLHYLWKGWNEARSFHPNYGRQLLEAYSTPKAKVSAIAAYAATAGEQRPELSGVFAAEFYRRRHPEVDWDTTDALLHYLSVGALRGDLPNPAFDPDYYASTHMTAGERARMSVLEHFEASPSPRPKTFALFDAAYYGRHPDLGFPDFDPATHYLKWGVWEGRRCSPVLSAAYIYNTFPQKSFADVPAIGEYLARRANQRRRLLFVGHEATRTGAPGILLRLVQHFDACGNIDCISIIDQDGPLAAQHAKVSHTVIPHNNRLKVYQGEVAKERLVAELDELMAQFADNTPEGVFCNSSEVRLYGEYFRARGLPVIFLMHEIADLYTSAELAMVTANCDHLVFPAQFVAEAFRRALPGDTRHHQVLPQGLLRDSFGDLLRGRRAELFRQWRLPAVGDAILVLGCGTIDGRKGFDHFVSVARKVRDARPGRVRFVWIGGRQDWRINNGALWDTTGYWASWDLKQQGLEQDVIVISETPEPEPFFVEADIFLLTSRVDPFPCVVHEAMASRLPILGFAGTGGAPEAYLPDAGMVIDYPDTVAMAKAVLALADDGPLRLRMGEAGRSRVKSSYRFATYGDRLIELMLGSAPPLRSARSSMRVYFTTPTWSLSGVATFTEELVRYLNAHGFEAEILITGGRFGPMRSKGQFYPPGPERLPDAPYRNIQPSDLSDAARQSAVREFLVANAPCILVPNYDYVVGELARDLPASIGVVGIAHADDSEHYDHSYRMGPFWDRVVAVSEEIAGRIGEMNPGFVPRLKTIRYGLTPPPAPVVCAAAVVRRESVAPIRLVYAGRFEVFQKRIYDYVELAQLLAARRVDFHLDLIGEGSELEAVRSRLDPLVRLGVVSIPGRLGHAETLARLRAAHVVLILSDFEGLPLCLIEGLQNGCVPVAYQMRSGIPEVITDGTNGLVLPPGDVLAVASAISALQEDPERLAALAEAAQRTPSAEGLTADAMGSSYAALFQAVFQDQVSGRGRQPRT